MAIKRSQVRTRIVHSKLKESTYVGMKDLADIHESTLSTMISRASDKFVEDNAAGPPAAVAAAAAVSRSAAAVGKAENGR